MPGQGDTKVHLQTIELGGWNEKQVWAGSWGVDIFVFEAQADDDFIYWCSAKLFWLWILSKNYTSEEILLDSVKLIFFPISYNRSWTHLIGNVSSKMRRNEAGSWIFCGIWANIGSAW